MRLLQLKIKPFPYNYPFSTALFPRVALLSVGAAAFACLNARLLKLPGATPRKNPLVTITYAVVLFSVLGQGLTTERLIRRLYPAE